jgi:hypothetical protein
MEWFVFAINEAQGSTKARELSPSGIFGLLPKSLRFTVYGWCRHKFLNAIPN